MYSNLYIYDREKGEKVYFSNGVPQGTINSPLLFNIYINMILDEFNNDNGYVEIIKILFYADDAVLRFKLKD
jgi:hypothetical protein